MTNATTQIKMPTVSVRDIDEYGNYFVTVKFDDATFDVCCQTTLNHNYKETTKLSCQNDDGGDFRGSGLAEYLTENLEVEEYSEEWNNIIDMINACAQAEVPENSVLRVLKERVGDDSITYEKMLFDTYLDSVGCHKYVSGNGSVIVTTEDLEEVRAEKELLGHKVFASHDEYVDWFDSLDPENELHSGDARLVMRARNSIEGCDSDGNDN